MIWFLEVCRILFWLIFQFDRSNELILLCHFYLHMALYFVLVHHPIPVFSIPHHLVVKQFCLSWRNSSGVERRFRRLRKLNIYIFLRNKDWVSLLRKWCCVESKHFPKLWIMWERLPIEKNKAIELPKACDFSFPKFGKLDSFQSWFSHKRSHESNRRILFNIFSSEWIFHSQSQSR